MTEREDLKQTRLFDPGPKMKKVKGSEEVLPPEKYYVVLVPNVGDTNIHEFSSEPEMAERLLQYQIMAAEKRYIGEIHLFAGRILDYSNLAYYSHLNSSKGHTVEMKNRADIEYVGRRAVVTDEH